MSLEIAVTENTAAVRELISVLQSRAAGAEITNTAGAANTPADDKAAKAAAAKAAKDAKTKADADAAAKTATTDTAGPSWKDVTAAITKLSKAEKGRDKIQGLFAEYGVKLFPEMEPLGKNAEILAKIEALLNPGEPATDDLGLGI